MLELSVVSLITFSIMEKFHFIYLFILLEHKNLMKIMNLNILLLFFCGWSVFKNIECHINTITVAEAAG